MLARVADLLQILLFLVQQPDGLCVLVGFDSRDPRTVRRARYIEDARVAPQAVDAWRLEVDLAGDIDYLERVPSVLPDATERVSRRLWGNRSQSGHQGSISQVEETYLELNGKRPSDLCR